MYEKMFVYSILSLLIGFNIYFILTGLLGLFVLLISAVCSSLLFVYGLIKDKRETRKLRGWQKPIYKKITGGK